MTDADRTRTGLDWTGLDDGNSDNKAISVQLSWGLTELGNTGESEEILKMCLRRAIGIDKQD